ncbi:hypothetical protein U6P24_12365 [Cutibacterium acnes]
MTQKHDEFEPWFVAGEVVTNVDDRLFGEVCVILRLVGQLVAAGADVATAVTQARDAWVTLVDDPVLQERLAVPPGDSEVARRLRQRLRDRSS